MVEFNLELDGQATTWSVTPAADGCLEVTAGGNRREVSCRRLNPHALHLTVDGVGVNAFVHGDPQAKEIVINGVSYPVRDIDRVVGAAASGGAGPALPQEVTPPMPSVVVKVFVQAGHRVSRGERLVVVSAMKMETTLTAPFDAQVAAVNVSEGDKVMPGERLVDLTALGLAPEAAAAAAS